MALLAAPLVAGIAGTAHASTGSPFGNGFDKLTALSGGIEIKGWAIDPDTTSAIKVRITVDGSTTKDVTANVSRADIGKAYPSYGSAHGFSTTIAAGAGTHEVCVTALNTGTGANTNLGCKTVTVGGSTSGSTSTGSSTSGSASTSRPSTSNTGVPSGRTLTVHNGDLVVKTNGQVVDGLDVRGAIVVRADNVVIKNTRVRGRTGPTFTSPLIFMQDGNKNLVVQDSELIPESPSPHHYGIIGWNFTLERVEIAKVQDGVHIIGSNVAVRNSLIHDIRHYTLNGSPTHDDGIQIQVGSNHRIVNNTIVGGWNAAIQVTQDRGDTSDLQITGNWMSNGLCSVNIAEKSYGPLSGVTVSNNTFGRGQRSADCAIVRPTSTSLSASGNYFEDGAAVKLRNG